jgi:PAS domain S-box-containing protein
LLSDDAIVSKDLDGFILSWNSGAERLFGYTAAEAIGRRITMIIPAERLEEEWRFLEELRRGDRVEPFETVRRAKSGRLIDISVTMSPVSGYSGQVVAASKVARDITATKRAERALREEDRRKDEFLALLHLHRLLVVDDNRDSATSLAKVMKLLGGEVRTAHDGLEALAAAADSRPEVILMDVGIPRLNGYEAARRIRQQPWGRDIAIVALTGWGQEADRIQSKEAGCDGHLVKPVSVAELQMLLAKVSAARHELDKRV